MKKVYTILITLFLLANLFDIVSTLSVGGPEYEENLIIKEWWTTWGVAGLIAYKAIWPLLTVALALATTKLIGPYIFVPLISFGIVVNVLAALTNLAWIPYSWTTWLFGS